MSDFKTQLTEELAPMDWETLIPHAKRDAIIVVDGALDLVEVGVAIAEDNTALVKNWLSELLLHKPSLEELNDWNAQPEKQFNTLIVQPFVLVSAIAD
ncbi:MAG: DUF2288 domain-containing protein [Snowella sp.]|nr:DUF2288 domain-containing protein [Snowella sp.]